MKSFERSHLHLTALALRPMCRRTRSLSVGLASFAAACAVVAGGSAAASRTEETLADRVDGAAPALYFHAADTAVMLCATPGLTVVANLISRPAQANGGSVADKDAVWLKTHLDNGDCSGLPPAQQFNATAATPIFAHSSGVVWVAGVFSPDTPGAPAIGFVPLDRIALVPRPSE